MQRRSLLSKKHLGIISTVCGGLVLGLPATLQPAFAQTESVQGETLRNPCPQIYYEEPFNTNVLVPAGCSPNNVSNQLGFDQTTAPAGVTLGNPDGSSDAVNSGITRVEPYGSSGVSAPTSLQAQPPLPEVQGSPIATVLPTAGAINVRLINNTNAAITYEVIGDTEPRTLRGGEEALLTNLSVPTTITTVRQDGGLLNVTPSSTAQGMLDVSLQENLNLDETQGVLRIQDDGEVFVN